MTNYFLERLKLLRVFLKKPIIILIKLESNSWNIPMFKENAIFASAMISFLRDSLTGTLSYAFR